MFKDLLFVIENYKGRSEQNMLSTTEEFLNFLHNIGLSDCVNDVNFLLENSGFQWKSLNTAGNLIEFRRCHDELDLCEFLSGRYNDSLEKMQERNLHTFGPFDSFNWDVSVASFSPMSLSVLNALKEKYPRLEERCRILFSEKSSLDDIIKNCVQYQNPSLKQGGFYIQNVR